MKYFSLLAILALSSICIAQVTEDTTKTLNYRIVDTNQSRFFNNQSEIARPQRGEAFFGQDAEYGFNPPKYIDNGDGTVTDLVTGLMWQQSFDHNNDGKVGYQDNMTYSELLAMVEKGVSFAGYSDWRLPTIKEMYSLILFNGKDIAPNSQSTDGLTPFIDTSVFEFAYGDLSAGERLIDVQCATSTIYTSKEVGKTVFGVNFADGRIKGYGEKTPHGEKAFDYLLVRGNPHYGLNQLLDNGDGTITDKATGLMWMQNDNGEGVIWQDALVYAEESKLAGYSDWRLPNAKELQSIVDYTRSPAGNNTAAIDPLFTASLIKNEAGEPDFPWYWTSTTHQREGQNEGATAVYIAFGKSLGNMPGRRQGPAKRNSSQLHNQRPEHMPSGTSKQNRNWVDVHGAGSQRSDPKTGNPDDYAEGRGPQGDAIRIYNYVRLVRNTQ